MRYDEAVLSAATALFTNARLAPDTTGSHGLAIDPLIDGLTGQRSVTTRTKRWLPIISSDAE